MSRFLWAGTPAAPSLSSPHPKPACLCTGAVWNGAWPSPTIGTQSTSAPSSWCTCINTKTQCKRFGSDGFGNAVCISCMNAHKWLKSSWQSDPPMSDWTKIRFGTSKKENSSLPTSTSSPWLSTAELGAGSCSLSTQKGIFLRSIKQILRSGLQPITLNLLLTIAEPKPSFFSQISIIISKMLWFMDYFHTLVNCHKHSILITKPKRRPHLLYYHLVFTS